MTRADLEHLDEGQVVTSVDLTRAEAAALNLTKLVSVQPDVEGWRVTAAHAVGAVSRGDLTVRVTPKVGVTKVLSLLARAYGVTKGLTIDDELVSLGSDADLSAVLAVLYVQEATTALAEGPLRGYRTEDQSLPVLRGRLRMREQETRRFGMLVPLEVTVDEWTMDTDENRRLRAAGRALQGLPDLPPQVVRRLQRLDRMLPDVSLPVPGIHIPDWTPTRLNARLHRLLHLADLVLDHTSVEHVAGKTETRGFVVSMAWLFEVLVARLLRERDNQWVTQRQMKLDTEERANIKPDLLLQTSNGFDAVADTKYKLLDEDGKIPNADIYQLVTYCTRLRLPRGHLIYAGEHVDHPPYNVVGSKVHLSIHALDLQQDLDEIESRVRGIAGEIYAGVMPRVLTPGTSNRLDGELDAHG